MMDGLSYMGLLKWCSDGLKTKFVFKTRIRFYCVSSRSLTRLCNRQDGPVKCSSSCHAVRGESGDGRFPATGKQGRILGG